MNTARDQTISFAYGNLKLHNPNVKREDIEAAYDRLWAKPSEEMSYSNNPNPVAVEFTLSLNPEQVTLILKAFASDLATTDKMAEPYQKLRAHLEDFVRKCGRCDTA